MYRLIGSTDGSNSTVKAPEETEQQHKRGLHLQRKVWVSGVVRLEYTAFERTVLLTRNPAGVSTYALTAVLNSSSTALDVVIL